MEINMEATHINDHDKFYSYKGELFTKTFPMDWAVDQLPNTGTECNNCLFYGSWNGVFCMYCVDCASVYNGERGGGVYGHIHEGECGDPQSPTAAANTYLKGVSLKDIGDWEIQDCCAVFGVQDPQAGVGFQHDLQMEN
jgi:hypothetical protein